MLLAPPLRPDFTKLMGTFGRPGSSSPSLALPPVVDPGRCIPIATGGIIYKCVAATAIEKAVSEWLNHGKSYDLTAVVNTKSLCVA